MLACDLAATGLAATGALAVFTTATGSAAAAFAGYSAVFATAAAARSGLRAIIIGFVLDAGAARAMDSSHVFVSDALTPPRRIVSLAIDVNQKLVLDLLGRAEPGFA